MKKVVLTSLAVILSLPAMAFAVGKVAPIRYLQVFVHNNCKQPIVVSVDNNKGSVYKGDYHFDVSKGGQFSLRSSDDEEYYTFNYKTAVCTFDYKVISQPDFSMHATFYDCDTKPRCVISSWPPVG